uniref:general transcription factor II-I repeat domain-containing protein 2A-like n=1 Tax=Styela clava TaxID=7725 RepID=UPI001939C3ED|nr:general transcription factor II-I repeat domain-containing protein 2A-like [Styela clava]
MNENQNLERIQREVKRYKQQTNSFKNIFKHKNNISAASFHVSRVIAVHGKPLSDGEYIKTAFRNAQKRYSKISLTSLLKRIDELPIARNTVKERIIAMNEDVTEQLLLDLKQAKMFSICLNESTDVTSSSRLAVFARFPSGNVMKEELIELLTLSETTKGQDVTTELKKEFSVLGIDMENIVSTRNALCAKALQSLQNVLIVVTKTVNYIAARALNKRMFAELRKSCDSEYSGLLMYNNVRWLSCGNVLQRFVVLLKEVKSFLVEKNETYPELSEATWLNDLHFFADFTNHYNTLNTKLQGCGSTALLMIGHVKAFEKKLAVFSADLKED